MALNGSENGRLGAAARAAVLQLFGGACAVACLGCLGWLASATVGLKAEVAALSAKVDGLAAGLSAAGAAQQARDDAQDRRVDRIEQKVIYGLKP